jgi:hypothetical protein
MKCLAPIVAILLSACVIHAGPGPESYPPAHGAAGVTAWLVSTTTRIEGELLDARDTALVVLTSDQVALVPFSSIDSGGFAHSRVAVGHRRKPVWEDFESIRLLSRYPQGIPPDALRRILADKRQDSLVFIR